MAAALSAGSLLHRPPAPAAALPAAAGTGKTAATPRTPSVVGLGNLRGLPGPSGTAGVGGQPTAQPQRQLLADPTPAQRRGQPRGGGSGADGHRGRPGAGRNPGEPECRQLDRHQPRHRQHSPGSAAATGLPTAPPRNPLALGTAPAAPRFSPACGPGTAAAESANRPGDVAARAGRPAGPTAAAARPACG